MALLLAMYQRFRLVREKNQLALKLTQYTGKLDRITKNIERTQKRYTSLFAQLESRAKLMQSNATTYFQNMAGVGAGTFGMLGYSGLNTNVVNMMGGLFKNGFVTGKDNDGEEITYQSDKFEDMMNIYMNNNGTFPMEEDGKTYQNGLTKEDVAAFQQAMRMSQMEQQNRQMWAQQQTQNYGNDVSIWLDAQKAQLEVEQDAALEPLNYEETMMELEKTQIESRLERINNEIDSYKQLASQEAKNAAPTFGLG